MKRVHYHFKKTNIPFDASEHTDWFISVVQAEDSELQELHITFCDDEDLLQMNKKFLNHDYYTDILTFPGDQTNGISGELYISVDRVRENANLFEVAEEEELRRVMIHGVLHLLGYDDQSESDQAIMREREDLYLEMFHVKH